MRILFDSKQLLHKDPFGTLTPGQSCCLQIHVPATVGASQVICRIHGEGMAEQTAVLSFSHEEGPYHIFRGSFQLAQPGLYFYYFFVCNPDGGFRLFKQGDDTNMEAGELWQVSCTPADFTTPEWAKGAIIYQVFPDRFAKSGQCDLTGKLTPYTLHSHWDEEVSWQPDSQGKILNNDFFGGNFRGITEKLDYIAALGTTILYLNPICKSFSNHRYDTGDYKTPDPMLGTEKDFTALCQAAHEKGIRVILDGVFSHTGSDSLYFDKNRSFGGKGAYCDPQSPYYSWYQFHNYPDEYACWWNFDTLPTINKTDPDFINYIITAEDSVVAHWLKLGADGFRLDVVDELPDAFVLALKQRIRQLKPDALLIGEVWEDASNKISYNIRRRYFVDGMLDSVMNYPLRNCILNFFRNQDDGSGVKNTVMTLAENYPPQVFHCNMNLLGTHDTPRILTALVDDFTAERAQLADRRLSADMRVEALQKLMAASFLQFTLPGAPSIYYADEAGAEGFADPFNRRPYPWGKEDEALLAHFRRLGQLRREHACLQRGDIHFIEAAGGRLGFCRKLADKHLNVYINRSDCNWDIPAGKLLLGHNMQTVSAQQLSLAPGGFCVTEPI